MAKGKWRPGGSVRPGITVSGGVWQAAKERAEQEKLSLSDVINGLLANWAGVSPNAVKPPEVNDP